MIKSKTINVFLMDGDPTLRIKCTLQNWTGIAYKIPRTMLEECKEGKNDIVNHLKQTGIYFLLGEDIDSGRKAIYIGQAVARKNGDGLGCRLLEHKRNTKEKYWSEWNEVVIFTTQNDSLGPTEISYLENKFTNLAKESNRYDVKNDKDPNPGNFTEEKESELLEFVDYARIIMGVLGHKVFEPIIQTRNTPIMDSEKQFPVFVFKGKYKAQGRITNEGFAVLKGSEISGNIKQSARKAILETRKFNNTRINNNILMEDILFTSPSAAAGFVGGCSLSGNVVWKTDDGKCPKDFNY